MASRHKTHPHLKKRLTKRRLREWMYGYLFILPWIVGLCIFFLYAMQQSFFYSLNDVRLSNGRSFTYVGFQNFANVFVLDNNYPVALIGFVMTIVIQLPVIVSFALIMALLLNSKIKAKGLFRVIFFLPVIIATGPVMQELTRQGAATVPMVNSASFMQAIGNAVPYWLADPILELFSSLILILWNSGVQILIFIAGLQKVSREMYEAARIDGASGWECFWKITLPAVKPLILLNAIYTIVAMATGGQNEVITIIYNTMFNSAVGRGYGFAAAMAWVYAFVVALLLAIAYLILREKSDRHVVYEQKRVRKQGVRT